jgi:hypothetical protein
MLYHRKDSNAGAQQYARYHGLHHYKHFTAASTMPLALPPALRDDTAAPAPTSRQHIPSLDLPPIPRLLGHENLNEWDDILLRILRLHGLAEYVTTPYPGVPEPPPPSPWAPPKYLGPAAGSTTTGPSSHEQWERDRALVCLLIMGSLSLETRDTLLACGYDLSEINPKVIYDLV